MAQLMLINPRKRRATKRKAATTKRRTKRKTAVTVRSNPTPVRRRRTLKTVAKRSRRIRRNPIGMGGVMGMLTDAAIGGVGAVGVNFLFDKLPVPVNYKTGVMGAAAKAAVAVAVGTFGKKLLGNTASKMAAGALTVIAYDLARNLMPAPAIVLPAANVNGMGYIGSGMDAGYLNGVGEYVNGNNYNFATGMGEYIQGGNGY
jgi:hypothetical protein